MGITVIFVPIHDPWSSLHSTCTPFSALHVHVHTFVVHKITLMLMVTICTLMCVCVCVCVRVCVCVCLQLIVVFYGIEYLWRQAGAITGHF